MNKGQVQKVTAAQMAQILLDPTATNGCTFVGFDALTVPSNLRKTIDTENEGRVPNPDHGKVHKTHTGQVAMIFSDKHVNAYQNMINRRLEKDGKEADFQVSERRWGTRVPNTPVVVHQKKGETQERQYLYVIYAQKAKTLVDTAKEMGIDLSNADQDLIAMLKDNVLSYDTFNGEVQYYREGQPIKKSEVLGLSDTSEGKQGGLDENKKVIPRTFEICNLTRVTFRGTTYIIEN